MKNTSAALNICLKACGTLLLIALVLILVLFISWHTAQAQNEPVKTNGNDVKQYLTDKYIEIHDVLSTIEQTQEGPRGSLNIRGKIVPKAEIVGADKTERSRAIAKAFILEETSLFGITNIDELREFAVKTDNYGYTHIYYYRYIGDLPFKEMRISVHLAPDENITSISSNVVPITPELYQAATKETLTESEIRKIVEDYIEADAESPETDSMVKALIKDTDPKTMKLKKLAISSPPYVVWEVHTVWVYTIDAFTGEILKKLQGWHD